MRHHATLMRLMGAAVLLAAATGASQASVVIDGTRVVFASNESEVSVRMSNEGVSPSLVQVWLDTGDPKARPSEIRAPFVLTPPMFRIEPAQGQVVRIIYNQEPLAQDRESLFWLNMLEVPPKVPKRDADAEDINYMQMAFRTRIKMFFRPAVLNKEAQIKAAPTKVTWRLLKDPNDAAYVLEGKNPTGYYLSVIGVGFVGPDADKKALPPPEASGEAGMMAPGETRRYILKDLKQAPAAGSKLRFAILDDLGGGVVIESPWEQ